MFQYLKFDNKKANESEFSVIKGKTAFKFLAKQGCYVLFFIYATLFLAVATPFVTPHSLPIYIIGIIITIVFLIRFINSLVMFIKFKNSKISFFNNAIEINKNGKTKKILSESMLYIEINFLNNLIIHEKEEKTLFPAVLLSLADSESLIKQLTDIAPKRTEFLKKVVEIIDAVLMAMILAVHIIQYIIQNFFIPSCSMQDTLMVGDHLFAEKITYGPTIPQMLGMKNPIHLDFLSVRKVERGDIIIFTPPIPADEDKDYIKRCIAIEGDSFAIKDGSVYINGKKLDEPYAKDTTSYDGFEEGKLDGIVPKGKVIALGDNRKNSKDGRFFGYLDVSRIKAKAFILYWNKDQIFSGDFSRIGLIK